MYKYRQFQGDITVKALSKITMSKQTDDVPLAHRRAFAARLLSNGEGISEVSWITLPLTDAPERFAGRSERSSFSLVALAQRATTFLTVSANSCRSRNIGSRHSDD